MTRRLHAKNLRPGDIAITSEQAHHLRRVLRLAEGEPIELFDDEGNFATGVLRFSGSVDASVHVESVTAPMKRQLSVTIASAIPKGERADWMIEKLSEIGVDVFIPLAAARSVVLPDRPNRLERWARIARESAEQSRRIGTMRIEKPMPLDVAIKQLVGTGMVCSTARNVIPIDQAAQNLPPAITLFIGPEGGWTDEELTALTDGGIVSVGLTQTVLRVETAAIAAAAVLLMNHPECKIN